MFLHYECSTCVPEYRRQSDTYYSRIEAHISTHMDTVSLHVWNYVEYKNVVSGFIASKKVIGDYYLSEMGHV